MKRLLLLLVLISAMPAVAQFSAVSCTHGETGVCRQATTCSQANVQAAVTASSAGTGGYISPTSLHGDGVYIPAGSCSWGSSVSWLDKNIGIIGGVGGTTTIATSGDAFDVSVTGAVGNGTTTAAAFRISNLTISGGHPLNINTSNPNMTTFAGYFRFDNITYNTSAGGNAVIIFGPVYGVFDHLNGTVNGGNHFEEAMYLNSEFPATSSLLLGETVGRTFAIGLGDQNAVYIENSTFNCAGAFGSGAISDSESGPQRMVFRDNAVTGSCYHYAHWTRNGEWDGGRIELYNNNYTCGGSGCAGGYPGRFDAGTGVIFNNALTGYGTTSFQIDEARGCGAQTGGIAGECVGSPPGNSQIDANAGDTNAPGWPCAGQVGTACTAGGCARSAMNSVPFIMWNNGAQAGCSTGGSCTNSYSFNVDGPPGGGSCTRTMTNYLKSTAHSLSGSLNGAIDYFSGASKPSSVGIYTAIASYAPFAFPYPTTVSGSTWYVNASGGNRFSVNVPAGQCNGQSPAAYPGTGVNQNCAFNDIRYLWTDGTFTTNVNAGSPKWGWVIAGGDTAIIDCTGMTGNSCRIGASGPNSGDSFGLNGDPFSAGAPTIPAGTSGAHTKILGKNFASCSSASSETLINGGYGISWVFSLGNTNHVDLQCVNVTDGSICNKASSFAVNPCSTSYPLDDYATTGLNFYGNSTNIHVQDVSVHGTAASCFFGPTGDVTTISNVVLSGCPHSNWDMDPGDGTTGTGVTTLTNVYNVFSGFEEVWPINPANNIVFSWGAVGQVGDGTDQNVGGYGDAFGTATVQSSPAWTININGGGAAYATQDGYDFLHVTGNGSRININHVFSYGNMGQQVKLGAAGTLENSLLIGNCNANKFVPGLAALAVAQLSLYCRAGDSAIFVAINNGESTNVYFNTLVTASVIGYEVATEATCNLATCVLNFKNNILSGFANSTTNGYSSGQATNKLPNPMFFDNDNPYPLGGSTYDHNATFNQWTTAPCPNSLYNETNALCTSPQLVDMTWHLYDLPNVAPASGTSAVVGAGIAVSGIATDYNGATRPNPPSMGALEFSTTPSAAQVFGSMILMGNSVIIQP